MACVSQHRVKNPMRTAFLMFSLLVSTAACADDKKDAYLQPMLTAAEVKAMGARVDPVVRKAIAEALAAEPQPSSLPQSGPSFSSAHTDVMTAAFNEARVPDCLHSDGLKRQPTFLLSGYLALPFIPIAALRGVCR